MALTYQIFIDALNNDRTPTRLSFLTVKESYNAGWSGNAFLAPSQSSDTASSLTRMLIGAIGFGLSPGTPAAMLMALSSTGSDETNAEEGSDDPELGTVVRVWPSVISQISPVTTASGGSLLNIIFVDPITFLSERPIWGAYRGVSIAEMIGGAFSLAAGGDGKPTLTPLLPGMPRVEIVDRLRDELSLLPYSIAAGETLGEWLETIENMLGIRIETFVREDRSTEIILTDTPCEGNPLQMDIVILEQDGTPSDPPSSETSRNGALYVSSIVGARGARTLGTIVDDPTRAAFARIGPSQGAIGNVVNSTGVTLEEANKRSRFKIVSAYSNMLTINVRSRQPGLLPGKLIRLTRRIAAIEVLQVVEVTHIIRLGVYDNTATLVRGDSPWYPSSSTPEDVRFVTGLIDGGDESITLEPVPRDRLGRVPVALSFNPSPLPEDLRLLRAADTDLDQRLTLDDFKSDAIDQYESDTEAWEAKVTAYNNREYDDPHPGREDDDLSEDELAERKAAKENREGALKYLAYKKAKALDQADKDRDGYRSRRDSEVSPELEALLRETGSHERIREQLEALKAGETTDDANPISEDLLREYDGLFNDPDPDSDEPDPHAGLRQDAALAKERWPPRIPLTAIEPMAGGLHGFIPGHRHGDICRVAIHNPLFAEIVGYQYRADRQINPGAADVTTGMIVEHDFARSWSGLVFRRMESPEPEQEPEQEPEEEPEQEPEQDPPVN